MNRVKENSGWEHLIEIAKIEGLSRAYTWNPARGCSNLECEVRRRGKCWAMMMAKRFGWNFEPHLVPEKLHEPCGVKEPAVITPVSVGDFFGLTLPQFRLVWRIIELADWHVYALLTKLPNVALDYLPLHIKGKIWFGVTVNSQKDVWRLDVIRKLEGVRKYCLFEPLYGIIDYDLSFLDLVVIGPQNYPTVQPKREWIESVVKNAGTTKTYFKGKLRFK